MSEKAQFIRFNPARFGFDERNPHDRRILNNAAGDFQLLEHEVMLDYIERAFDQGVYTQMEHDVMSLEALRKSDARRAELGLPPIPDASSRPHQNEL